jgi:hypothetical protein
LSEPAISAPFSKAMDALENANCPRRDGDSRFSEFRSGIIWEMSVSFTLCHPPRIAVDGKERPPKKFDTSDFVINFADTLFVVLSPQFLARIQKQSTIPA